MSVNCKKVLTLKQYGPTCWFNSILMAVLYSEKSRKLLLENSKKWNKKIKLFKTLAYMLQYKYLRTDNVSKDYLYFDKVRPEHILEELHKYNSIKFHNLTMFKNGYVPALYIRKIYKLLGAKVLFLDYTPNKQLYYSLYNNVKTNMIEDDIIKYNLFTKPLSVILKNFDNPDVIIIHIVPEYIIATNHYPFYYDLNYLVDNNYITESIYDSIYKLGRNITYKDYTYSQDSVLLSNWNDNIINKGHSVAGITCEGERYVYNGWSRTTIDPNIIEELSYYDEEIAIPCEMMKFPWDVAKNSEFCLNPRECILDSMNVDVNNLCFNFNKGSREIIYVKDSRIDYPDSHDLKESPVKSKKVKVKVKPDRICPDGKVINPLSGRCILLKNLNKLPKKPVEKKVKPNDKSQIAKKVQPKIAKNKKILTDEDCFKINKILNPKTNKCNKQKPVKPDRICPEGKVINPISGRCILIKNLNKLMNKAK